MVKVSKHILSLFLALIMCIGICPMPVFAEDHVFTVQPVSGYVDPDTLTFTIDCEADFVPTKVMIVHGYSSVYNQGHIYDWVEDVTVTSGLSKHFHYEGFDPSKTCSDSFYQTFSKYRVLYFYGDGTGDHVASDEFSISYSQVEITEDVNVERDTDSSDYVITCKTSFVPQKVRIVHNFEHYLNNGFEYFYDEDKVITNGLSKNFIYTGFEPEPGKNYYLLMYYGDNEDFFLYSNAFHVSDTGREILEQPETGSLYTEQVDSNDYNQLRFDISCKTNFVPKKVVIVHNYVAGSGTHVPTWTVDKTYTSDLTNEFYCNDFMPEFQNTNSSIPYRLVLYYDYNGTERYLISDSFKANTSGLGFSEEPESGYLQEDGDVIRYKVPLKYDNPPSKVIFEKLDGDTFTQYPYPWEQYVIAATPGKYRITLIYSDDITYEAEFTVYDIPLNFTVQPESTIPITNAFNYSISAEVDFVPLKTQIIYTTNNSAETIVGETDENLTNNITYSLWRGANAGSEYHYFIRAYYNESRYIDSQKFTLDDSGLAFVYTPNEVLYDIGHGLLTDTAVWATTFIPSKVELLKNEYIGSSGLTSRYDYVLKKTYTADNCAMNTGMALPYDDIVELGCGKYKIQVYYADDKYLSAYFEINEPKFTLQPVGGTASSDGKYTVSWETNIPTDLINDIRFESIIAPGVTHEFYYPENTDTSCEITMTPGENAKDYSVVVYFDYNPDRNSGFISGTLESTEFHVERFRFTQEPGGSFVNEEFVENANIVPFESTLSIYWKTAVYGMYSPHYEFIYAPADDSAEPVSVDCGSTGYYRFHSPNEWKDYICYVRAWLKDDVQILSYPFTVHCEGPGATIACNGGSYGVTFTADYDPILDLQQTVKANSDGIATLPFCTIVPPEGMMFDKWCVTDHKAYLMAQGAASEQLFITEDLLVNGDDGFPKYDYYTPGDTISVETGLTYVFPLWKTRVDEWIGGDISKEFDEEALTFFIDESLSPYIPYEFCDICYEMNDVDPETTLNDEPAAAASGFFGPRERDWVILYSTIVDGETEFYYMEIEAVPDVNAPGGNRYRVWGPTDPGNYTLVLMYKDEVKLLVPFAITSEEISYTKVDAKEATYESDGNSEYYIGSDEKYYIFVDDEYQEIEENSWVIPMLEKTKVIIKSVDINGIATPTTVYAETYTNDDYIVTNAPYMDGYNFNGWKVNGTLYTTADEVQSAIAALVAEKPETAIEVTVVYEQKNEAFKVTVMGGTLNNGVSGDSYQVGTELTVTAAPAEEGYQFDHWENNGEAASYNETYPFHVPSKDITLKAVYSSIETEVEKVGTAYIESVTTINGNKIAFVSKVSVPEGGRILKAGIVANTEADLNGSELTTDTAQFTRYDDSKCYDYLAYKFTWTKSNVSESDIWCVRSYLVYKDENGDEHTLYGELVKANLNGIITE